MDLVIWPSPKTPLYKVSRKFDEDPTTGFLNSYCVVLEKSGLTDSDFLTKFEWKILRAKLRPQFHVIILDSTLVTAENKNLLSQTCVCASDFVATHPMKYVIFYDLINYQDCAEVEHAFHLNHRIRSQSESLSSFVRLHAHSGPPLQPQFVAEKLNLAGLNQLATAITHLVNQVVSGLND
jgi:hypothetical protein